MNKRFFLAWMMLCMIALHVRAELVPTRLRCEQMDNPFTVDVLNPRLSWINKVNDEAVQGERQTAYRICVASSREKLLAGDADVWDTGKKMSDQSVLVPFQGNELVSGGTYWWRVKVWNKDGHESEWSEPAYWGMGLLSASEWRAKWIGADWEHGAAPTFRRSFTVKKAIDHAKLFVTALGYYEVSLNGQKVGDDFFVPNISNANKRPKLPTEFLAIPDNFTDYRVFYLAYDVSSYLHRGTNRIQSLLGEGMYNAVSHWIAPFGENAFLCQLEITYEDGTKEVVVTDENWEMAASPIVMNGVYAGEIYDAVKAHQPENWRRARVVEAPAGKLTAQTAPSDKLTEVLKPVSVERQDDGSYLVDFGKEISGWIHLKDIVARRGDTIHVRYLSESPLGVQKYIHGGTGKESYAPRFTWFVFRKAVIVGCKDLAAENLQAEAVNTDLKLVAHFETSNPLYNQINTIWQRSEMDNLHGGIQSDCPHRERNPYLGDGQVVCHTVMENFDAAAFYHKWIQTMRDSQDKDTGYVPNSAPWQSACGGGVAWGAAMNIIPWEYYQHYGDLQELKDNYQAMKDQVRYMLTWLTEDGTMLSQRTNVGSDKPNQWFNLGDWVPPFELPDTELVHTFYLWYCADINAKAAKALGLQDDELYYKVLAEKVWNAFHRKFYRPAEKSYGDYGSNVFALVMGVPDADREAVVETLRHEIAVRYKGHFNTGIFGTRFLPETLARYGMNDLACEVMNQTDFPSFGDMIRQGATTMWEQWDGKNSRNHPMFGGALSWFYRYLAGVQLDESRPGYKHFSVKPILTALERVCYAVETSYGLVGSEIVQTAREVNLCVTVPVGCSATVTLPISNEVKELQQGTYRFTISKNE